MSTAMLLSRPLTSRDARVSRPSISVRRDRLQHRRVGTGRITTQRQYDGGHFGHRTGYVLPTQRQRDALNRDDFALIFESASRELDSDFASRTVRDDTDGDDAAGDSDGDNGAQVSTPFVARTRVSPSRASTNASTPMSIEDEAQSRRISFANQQTPDETNYDDGDGHAGGDADGDGVGVGDGDGDGDVDVGGGGSVDDDDADMSVSIAAAPRSPVRRRARGLRSTFGLLDEHKRVGADRDDDGGQLGRGHRQTIKPLEHWRGEYISYRRTETAIGAIVPVIEKIVRISKTPENTNRKKNKKSKR